MHIAQSNSRICLHIPGNSIAEGQAKYVLCAVQNHLGNLAHVGHYIANVLDWKTGVWYELNDEDVNILDSGPLSSFELIENEYSNDLSLSNGHRKVG